MKVKNKIIIFFISCFLPVISNGQGSRLMPLQSITANKIINVMDYGARPDDSENDWHTISLALHSHLFVHNPPKLNL